MLQNTSIQQTHSDHLGSSSLITDANGQLDQHYQYLPFGEPFVSQKLNTGVRFTFSGKERDSETNLSYFGARYYTSDLGVWLSVDPLAGVFPFLTPYNFVENNPIMLIDPTGLGSESPSYLLNEVTLVGKAPGWFSRIWNKINQFFGKHEFTATIRANIDIGVQAGLKTPLGQAKINATSIQLFDGEFDLTDRKGYIHNTILSEGAIVSQEASVVVKLPVKLPNEKVNLSISASAGQKQRITDNNGWLQNGGFSSSDYETYSNVNVLVPIVQKNPTITTVGQNDVKAKTNANISAENNFKGFDSGIGGTFILGIDLQIKIGFNENN